MTGFRCLVSAETVANQLPDPAWVLVDCSFDLGDVDAGERAYRSGHLPGAFYAHLDHDLAAPVTPGSGRHPLPAPERLAETLSSWGMHGDSQLVAYDTSHGAFAARLWWLCKWLGHDRVAVLDGGPQAWLEAGLPLERSLPSAPRGRFAAEVRAELVVSTAALAAALSDGERLLDARAPERFRGAVEPLDRKAGHVPGAVNHPFQTNLAATGRFLPAGELQQRYANTLGQPGAAPVICMCGSGVTACHNLLALEIAGIGGARLYAGSWSEWIQDPANEVATGE